MINYDIIFVFLLFGIPVVLSVFSLFFYFSKKKSIIQKLKYSNFFLEEVNKSIINDQNSFVEYNHIWRLIQNIKQIVNQITDYVKKEERAPEINCLEGIIQEIQYIEKSRIKLILKPHSTKLLYMYRSFDRIKNIVLCIHDPMIIKAEQYDYLIRMIDNINEYIRYGNENKYLNIREIPKEDINISDYIKNRIDPTIICYNNKALTASISFTCFSIIQIIYSALIPVSLLISNTENANIIGALYGAFLTISSSISAFGKFKEKWLQNHELRDKLLTERNFYIADVFYKKPIDFMDTCEKIISLEHKNLSEFLNNLDTTPKKE